MKAHTGHGRSLVLLLLLAAVGLAFAPPSAAEALRATLRDGLRPGQLAFRRGETELTARWAEFRASPAQREAARQLKQERDDWEARYRRLEVQTARSAERSAAPASPLDRYVTEESVPLVVPELVAAHVLGAETGARWRTGWLIGAGTGESLRESSLVLDDPRTLVDQGSDHGLATGHPVYAGRSVLGKVATVGRWSSTVQLVTDPDYRGRAQIVRQTPLGPVFGGEGILEGQGTPLCRLSRIAATLPVAVGDAVYTGARDGLLPFPLFYGTIVRAELQPGEPYWEIELKPASPPGPLETVHVLRMQANPVRLLAN